MTGIIQKLFGFHTPGESHVPPAFPPAEPGGPQTPAEPGSADLPPGLPGSSLEELELPAPAQPELSLVAGRPADLLQLIAGCAQSVGCQRDHNEDALFSLTTSLATAQAELPLGLYIVADGMGGHRHGELASGIAVRQVASQVLERLFTALLGVVPGPPDASLQEILRSAAQQTHRTIQCEVPGSGTTLTMALVLGAQVVLAHVGDSRAYIITPEKTIQTLTRDHSLVNRLVELGHISSDEAANHPQRNVLYRALGQGDAFDIDITSFPAPRDGLLLLCSDGLWGVVPEAELLALLSWEHPPDWVCQRLVDAANSHGGPDNITAILVHLPA